MFHVAFHVLHRGNLRRPNDALPKMDEILGRLSASQQASEGRQRFERRLHRCDLMRDTLFTHGLVGNPRRKKALAALNFTLYACDLLVESHAITT